jgi:pilus assembly protein FimV
MMNNNKILTVSYGTFSCTLEGFDDSFGTMKVIAEYFRDLAAEDRYFGAEPPQPDANMLAHIAQKEISRKVVGYQQDGQIVLKAREDAPAPVVEQAAPAVQAPAADLPVYDDADEAEAQTQAAPKDEAEAKVDLTDVDIVPGQPDEEIKAFFDEKAADEPARPSSEASQNSSIAAKLQRIRSVVSRQDVDAPDADYTEDEHADENPAPMAENNGFVADAVKDIESALAADDAVEAADPDANEDPDDAASAQLNRLYAETGTDDLAATNTADAFTADEDANSENLFDGDASTSPEPAAAPRGRVVKVKRADLTDAIARGNLEEYSEDDDADVAQPDDMQDRLPETVVDAPIQSSLSAEEEDELARELAEVEADFADDVSGADTSDDAMTDVAEDDDAVEPAEEAITAETNVNAEPRRKLPSLDDAQGADMSRLLAETDNQMDDPEGTVRRDAIAHLRAAVAAKKADMAMGANDSADDDGTAYRSDLAEVVKPRRPAATATRTDRPSEPRPAPLKLVAEQRIDINYAKPDTAAPVRPRRVAAVAPTPAAAAPVDGGFVKFAADMGASTLSELLEASAAYLSFVEGIDQFSRPQLMQTVRQAEKEDFSREEGLRAFGQLLRAGKLIKLDGGRFKASDDIGYQPEERAAG